MDQNQKTKPQAAKVGSISKMGHRSLSPREWNAVTGKLIGFSGQFAKPKESKKSSTSRAANSN